MKRILTVSVRLCLVLAAALFIGHMGLVTAKAEVSASSASGGVVKVTIDESKSLTTELEVGGVPSALSVAFGKFDKNNGWVKPTAYDVFSVSGPVVDGHLSIYLQLNKSASDLKKDSRAYIHVDSVTSDYIIDFVAYPSDKDNKFSKIFYDPSATDIFTALSGSGGSKPKDTDKVAKDALLGGTLKYRIGSDGTWQSVSSSSISNNLDPNMLSQFGMYGATLYFKIAGNNASFVSTDGHLIYNLDSPAVTLKIPKAANAPKATVDYQKEVVKFPKGVHISSDLSGDWKEKIGTYDIAGTKALSVPLYAFDADPAIAGSVSSGWTGSGISFYFENAASGSSAARSKLGYISIPKRTAYSGSLPEYIDTVPTSIPSSVTANVYISPSTKKVNGNLESDGKSLIFTNVTSSSVDVFLVTSLVDIDAQLAKNSTDGKFKSKAGIGKPLTVGAAKGTKPGTAKIAIKDIIDFQKTSADNKWYFVVRNSYTKEQKASGSGDRAKPYIAAALASDYTVSSISYYAIAGEGSNASLTIDGNPADGKTLATVNSLVAVASASGGTMAVTVTFDVAVTKLTKDQISLGKDIAITSVNAVSDTAITAYTAWTINLDLTKLKKDVNAAKLDIRADDAYKFNISNKTVNLIKSK